MQKKRLLPCFALLTVLAAVSAPALAQSVTLNEASITRKVPYTRKVISRSDCLADDVFYFPVILTNYAGTALEVWAGESGDCTDATQRHTSAATCWRLYSAAATSYTMTVPIRVQDIIAQRTFPADGGGGTAAECNPTSSATGPIQVTLYFMLMQGTSILGTGVKWTTRFDLVGPAPPTGVGVRADGTTLTVNWTATADPDVAGYVFMCDPPPGDPSPASDAGVFLGVCPQGLRLVPSDVLTPTPAADVIARHYCGTAGPADTSFTVNGLLPQRPYAVAVTSFDSAENIGTVSAVACASTGAPDAGACPCPACPTGDVGAGGGSCSMAAGRSRAISLLAGAAMFAMLRARRRRH